MSAELHYVPLLVLWVQKRPTVLEDCVCWYSIPIAVAVVQDMRTEGTTVVFTLSPSSFAWYSSTVVVVPN